MKIPKAEYITQIREIEDTFAGPSDIVGERVLLFRQNEQERAAWAPNVYHGFYDRLMDSFFDFGIQLHQETKTRPQLYDMSLLISALWTLRSSYILFWGGYYCNATALLRSVLEAILLLTAENNGKIQRFKLCAIMDKAYNSGSSLQDDKIVKASRKMLKQTHDHLLGGNSQLNSEDQAILGELVGWLHPHVHHSFFSFFSLFKNGKRNGTIPILPGEDQDQASHYILYSEAFAWAFLRIMWRLIQPSGSIEPLRKRFNVLDRGFTFSSREWPAETARAWINFLNAELPVEDR